MHRQTRALSTSCLGCLSGEQAKDTELIQYATEIKVRAERRCGELLKANLTTPAERGSMGAEARWDGKSSDTTSHRPTLADMGLTKDESSRYQQLAAMPAEHFETAVATAKATAGDDLRRVTKGLDSFAQQPSELLRLFICGARAKIKPKGAGRKVRVCRVRLKGQEWATNSILFHYDSYGTAGRAHFSSNWYGMRMRNAEPSLCVPSMST